MPDWEAMNPLLRMAVLAGVEGAVRLHIRRGDNLDARDNGGATPLMLAARRRRRGVVELLLSAGADPRLTDRSGRDALAHAELSGSAECAAIVRSALSCLRTDNPWPGGKNATGLASEAEKVSHMEPDSTQGEANTATAAAEGCEKTWTRAREETPLPPIRNMEPVNEPAESTPSHEPCDRDRYPTDGARWSGQDESDESHCFSRWEPETESVAPEGNEAVVNEVRALHEAIGRHKAIDTDEDWANIEAFLPERAVPLVREDGEEPSVRSLLLRALREGSVPESLLVEVCLEVDGSRNLGAERLLCFVLGDLGASIDERDESDGAPHMPGETLEEEPIVSKAMEHAEELASGRNEPLRLYLRGFKGVLLTAEEELALGRAMEEAAADALDALADWSAGVAAVLDAGRRVAGGEANVEAYSSGPQQAHCCELASMPADADPEDEVADLDAAASAFLAAVREVEASVGEKARLRSALAAANLSRGFLLELAKATDGHGSGADFAAAVTRAAAARERMILSNLRLAFSLARKYMRSGEPLDDLVQEGNIGLMKAVERYDWRKGFRFSTYATWWIRQQISRAIADKSRTIRIPVHMHETVRRTKRERDEFEAKVGRPEKLEEMADRLGLPVWKARRILEISEVTASLDEPDAETGLPLAELLQGPDSDDPCLRSEAASLRSTLLGMIGELEEREGQVVTLRFGLGDEDPMTLEEVGQRFDLTRQRIRQIEAKALRRLSHATRKEILSVYMGDGFGQKREGPACGNPEDESKLEESG